MADLAANNRQVVALAEGMALGARNINDRTEWCAVTHELRALAKSQCAPEVYGVFAAPIQASIATRTAAERPHSGPEDVVMCYAAWNVARSVEGGKPSFTHKEFLWVGVL
jgi:hypothetical protein